MEAKVVQFRDAGPEGLKAEVRQAMGKVLQDYPEISLKDVEVRADAPGQDYPTGWWVSITMDHIRLGEAHMMHSAVMCRDVLAPLDKVLGSTLRAMLPRKDGGA